MEFKKHKIISTPKLKYEILEEIYAYKRYGIHFCLAIFESKNGNLYKKIKENIRITDRVVRLDKNITAVLYKYTDIKAGIKAAENLLYKLEKETRSKVSCGIVSFENSEDSLVNRAFYALEKARKDPFSKIEDDYFII
ncbi:hypothetical protein [Nitrosophilus alvini]|uniref:hypothetical protein n=1 Tax=Nitrosophilus alvini TaxID=2714855 RepID=UPI00190AD4CF|nr:hypothetical protein [Nitrosophilus alvini]